METEIGETVASFADGTNANFNESFNKDQKGECRVNGEVNGTYDSMDISSYGISPSPHSGELQNKKGNDDVNAKQPESCKAAEVPKSQLESLRELGSEVPSSLGDSCVLQKEKELISDMSRTDCVNTPSSSVLEEMDINESCDKDTGGVSPSDNSMDGKCNTSIELESIDHQPASDKNASVEEIEDDADADTKNTEEYDAEASTSKQDSETSEGRENGEGENDNSVLDCDKSDTSSTPSSSSKKSKKSPTSLNVTPRRSSRNLNKQKCYVTKDDDDMEVQVLSPVDPLGDPLADPLSDSPSAGGSNKENKTRKKTTIIVNDTKALVEIAAGSKDGKKEPTLVIIDTNSILSGRGPVPVSSSATSSSSSSSASSSTAAYSVLPVAVPAQGFYPPNQSQNPAHYVSMPKAHHNYPQTHHYQPHASAYQYHTSHQQQQHHHHHHHHHQQQHSNSSVSGSSILHPPSLTDDMYVVEAPSFIVPYVYEKPAKKPLKDYLDAMAKELNIKKEKEAPESRISSMKGDGAEVRSKGKPAGEDNKASDGLSDNQEIDLTDEEEKGKKREKEKGAENKNGSKESSSGDEASAAISENGDDTEQKSLKKSDDGGSAKDDGNDGEESMSGSNNEGVQDESGVGEKSDSPRVDGKDEKGNSSKQPGSYFDSPIGKFFIQIGTNLVQEYVQTDLLKAQKRRFEREGGKSSATQFSINSLLKNLECSKENNEPFHFEQQKCEYCSFKTESLLVMAHHLECPHMKNYVYRCNFCLMEARSPHNLLYHMEAEHNIRGRLERTPAFHQCPNCPFEDNQKSKLTRHFVSCQKKYRPDRNQEPPADWEPPAKIPRIPRGRPPTVSAGYGSQGMAVPKVPGIPTQVNHPLLPKLVPTPANLASSHAAAAAAMAMRGRGVRPASLPNRYITDIKGVPRPIAPVQRYDSVSGLFYRPNSQVLLPTPLQIAGNQVYQSAAGKLPPSTKLLQQPSISITPLPRQPAVTSSPGTHGSQHPASSATPNPNKQNQLGNKATFVICEICDGYIKDLEQLRNHMQWIHKVKIHPKMIYNRPPLNCQKCQFRFFTDQGLERHLLGSHGLVTSSMQEAANKGKDGGRCPVCGRVYQWKLLNHVARGHNLTLKPAHLSYKCTVCTATFGMYKQFENHVYSAHSVGPKRGIGEKKPGMPVSSLTPGQQPSTTPSSSGSHRPQSSQHTDNLLKPLKINDEITIIPQPPSGSVSQLLVHGPCPGKPGTIVRPNQPHRLNQKHVCQMCDARFDGAAFGQLVNHYKRKHLQDCKVKLPKVDQCSKCKSSNHTAEECTSSGEGSGGNGGSGSTAGVDVIELSDDEVVIAGQGRHEITITKVPPSAAAAASSSTDPGSSKRLRKRNQQNVQVIEIEESPVKGSNKTGSNSAKDPIGSLGSSLPGTNIFKTGVSSGSAATGASSSAAAENGDDALSAVKERLRRRRSLEISQVDSGRGSDAAGGDPLADAAPTPSKLSCSYQI